MYSVSDHSIATIPGIGIKTLCTTNMASVQESPNDSYVGLKVGGKTYQTSRTTLTRYPNSFFSLLLKDDRLIPSAKDEQGNYLIDRDGEIFRHVLNFLRSGELKTAPEGFKEFELLEDEADFFMLDELKVAISKRMPVGLLFDDGKIFHTTKENLTKEDDSFFTKMLRREIEVTRDPQGNYVMDRDGGLFHHILSYLRDGGILTDITLDELSRLSNESDYFELSVFENHIQSIKFMQNRRDSLPFLHFYYSVNSPCFAYTNHATRHGNYNIRRVCPNLTKIMEGVYAGIAYLEKIKTTEGLTSAEDVVSYFCKKMGLKCDASDDTLRLSADCTRLNFAPF